MEVVLGNGYANGWLYDRMNRLNRLFNEAGRTASESSGHVLPRTDVIEHSEGYHFYFDMPGIKADSVERSGRGRTADGRGGAQAA